MLKKKNQNIFNGFSRFNEVFSEAINDLVRYILGNKDETVTFSPFPIPPEFRNWSILIINKSGLKRTCMVNYHSSCTYINDQAKV